MTAAVLTSIGGQPAKLARPGPEWMQLLAVFAFWSAVALLAAVADFTDQAGASAAPHFPDKLKLYGAVFLPFGLFSTALALAFARYPALLRPRRLLLLYLAALCIFVPVYGLYETAAVLMLEHKPLPGLLEMALMPPAWGRWLDSLMITIALAVQGAHAYWKHGQQQALVSRAAERANLALRLSLLQGQLEPAFLLSALDGIADLVRHAERSQATRALARLSDLLRHALRASQQDWISVAEEIAFLRVYVELQALRFGERVQVDWYLGESDWHASLCPPLLLHALFDHAIARSLETHAAAGPVRASFARAGARLRIELSHPQGAGPVDPGPVMAETHERLTLLYQGAATLVYSAAGARVCGALELPLREDPDD
jgi:two-component system sensor histidine kinase AlgZ